MERKFDIENFEKFLRDVSDELRMHPSRRVWNSIYNNMHPGKNWPSISVSILLFTAMVFLGYLNSENKGSVSSIRPVYEQVSNRATSGLFSRPVISYVSTTKPVSVKAIETEKASEEKTVQQQSVISNTKRNKDFTLKMIGALSQKKSSHKDAPKIYNSFLSTDPADHSSKLSFISQENTEMENGENNADHYNSQVPQKSTTKLSWLVYASPSVAYRALGSSNAPNENDQNTELTNTENDNISYTKPSLGVEVGATMQYKFLKNLKITTGLQLNYSKYYVSSNAENAVGSSNTVDLTTNSFSDKTSSLNTSNLSKEMYEISIPVGVVVKIAGSDHLFWNVGATIQPTFIMGEHGGQYSDNSIKNASSISKWNLNAGFETFISYKVSGITWQLGPQFRYQFLSPSGNRNTFLENPSIYGLKLGISRPIK